MRLHRLTFLCLFAAVLLSHAVGTAQEPALFEIPAGKWSSAHDPAAAVPPGDETAESMKAKHGDNAPRHLSARCQRVIHLIVADKAQDAADLLKSIREAAKSHLTGEDDAPEKRELRSALLLAQGFEQLRAGKLADFINTASDEGKLLSACAEPMARLRELDAVTMVTRMLSGAGRRQECTPWIGRVVAMAESGELPQRPALAENVAEMAMVARAAGLKANGEKLTETALKLAAGGEPVLQARVHERLGMHAEAVAALEKAGKDAQVLAELGRIHLAEFDRRRKEERFFTKAEIDAAEKCFQEADELTSKDTKATPQARALRMSGVADVLERRGKRVEALELRTKAFALVDKESLTYDPEALTVLAGLGQAHWYLNRLAKALELLGELLNRSKIAFGEMHPRVADAHMRLAQVHKTQEEFKEAEKSLERAAGVRERTLGTHHLQTAESYRELGRIRVRQQDINGAAAYFAHALKLDHKNLGAASGEVEEDLRVLTMTLCDLGREAEALAEANKLLDEVETTMGKNHPTLRFHQCIAMAQSRRGRKEATEEALKTGMDIQAKAFGPDHPRAAEARGAYAVYLLENGKSLKAAGLMRSAIL
ncbi:MAG: tetratricopeptide repeat protein, partial [Verrucomicrobiaceae bacterium]|nr:tetratricopeptide repeat protein [Verrucomicrobiaceae bacterium]